MQECRVGSQHLDLQIDALMKKGCDTIFQEKVSNMRQRPELDRYLSYLRKGDTLVIYKFDRLGCSLKNLLEIFDNLHRRGITLVSIQDDIDNSPSTGKLMNKLLIAFTNFEKSMIAERCTVGRINAKLKGKKLGRQKGVSFSKVNTCVDLYQSGKTIEEIQFSLGIKSRSTVYRWLRLKGIAPDRVK